MPESEIVLESSFESIAQLNTAARSLLESAAEPVIMDAHNLRGRLTLVTAFAGSREDVDYQLELARKVATWVESSTAYDKALPRRISVLRSTTADYLVKLGRAKFVARFGNGVIHHDGRKAERALPNSVLVARIKKAYDPHGIFAEYTL